MGYISIKTPDDSDDIFVELLRKNINRLINEKVGQTDFLNYYKEKSISNAISTIRVSLETKNQLKKLLKPTETYEELLQRLIETNERLKEEAMYLKKLENENQQLIKYVEHTYKREKKTILLHPDFKIEYSYNESKVKSYENFSFDVEIDNFLLQGKIISEREGIKTVQTINIIKSIKDIALNVNIKGIIQQKELLLESEEYFIKTKYLVYFKILFFIINKKLDKKLNDNNLMNFDFWKNLYDAKGLPNSSLEEDVNQKLKRFELEINQLRNDIERQWTNLK